MFFNISRLFDKAVSGSPVKQLTFLIMVFAAIYFFWLSMSTVLPKGTEKQINREIPEPRWSILAQMLDPGNQHMVGPELSSEQLNQTKTIDNNSTNQSEIFWLRLFAVLLSLTGTFAFGGLLISTITNIFSQRVSIIREGLMSYRFNTHILIIGFNNISSGLINQLLNAKTQHNKQIVILSQQITKDIVKVLSSDFSKKQLKRITVLYGERTSIKDLERARVKYADEIFILGENDEADHDSKNNACIINIKKILSSFDKKENSGSMLNCHVLYNSQTTHAAYQFGNIQDQKQGNTVKNLVINSFSFYENWAQKVFVDCKHKDLVYSPLDFEPISQNSNSYVHLIIAGMTRMGFAMGLQAIRQAHYANFNKRKTRVSFIDSNADREFDYFKSRFQSFCMAIDIQYFDLIENKHHKYIGTLDFIDIELVFIKANFESQEVRDMLLSWTNDKNALSTIAICFNNPGTALAAGLYMPDQIYQRNVNILVRQESEHSILTFLHADDKNAFNKYQRVKAFGMTNDCVMPQTYNHFKAMAVNFFYSCNNSLPESFSEVDINKMIELWNNLMEKHKWSSRYNSQSIPVKINALKTLQNIPLNEELTDVALKEMLTNNNIEVLSQIEHARWNVETLLAGFYPPSEDELLQSTSTADDYWRAVNNKDKANDPDNVNQFKVVHKSFVNSKKARMIHPCLAPYNALSEYYKDIDRRLTIAIPIVEKEFKKRYSL